MLIAENHFARPAEASAVSVRRSALTEAGCYQYSFLAEVGIIVLWIF